MCAMSGPCMITKPSGTAWSNQDWLIYTNRTFLNVCDPDCSLAKRLPAADCGGNLASSALRRLRQQGHETTLNSPEFTGRYHATASTRFASLLTRCNKTTKTPGRLIAFSPSDVEFSRLHPNLSHARSSKL